MMADDKQRKEFERVARELECDEDEGRFNASLKQIAKEGAKRDEKSDE